MAGNTYPVRSCQFEFDQATGERGRVRAKVRHGTVRLSLDVPDSDFLLLWGSTAYKPLAGHVTFFESDRRTARETLLWEAGNCVSYHENFVAGDNQGGAYVCHLTIAAPKLALQPGGPPRPLAVAAPRDYATAAASNTVAALPKAEIISDCTESVRQNLQNQVKQNCKNGKQSCLISDSCPVLEETMEALNACIVARTKINMKCFKGGDDGHKEQIENKVKSLIRCQGYYFNKCNKPAQPVPVPRTVPVALPPIPKEVPITIAGVGLFILYLLSGALRPGPI